MVTTASCALHRCPWCKSGLQAARPALLGGGGQLASKLPPKAPYFRHLRTPGTEYLRLVSGVYSPWIWTGSRWRQHKLQSSCPTRGIRRPVGSVGPCYSTAEATTAGQLLGTPQALLSQQQSALLPQFAMPLRATLWPDLQMSLANCRSADVDQPTGSVPFQAGCSQRQPTTHRADLATVIRADSAPLCNKQNLSVGARRCGRANAKTLSSGFAEACALCLSEIDASLAAEGHAR